VKSREDQELRARKVREAALVLPFIGFLLLTPPFAKIFGIDSRILGVPTVVVYVFAIWLSLIVIARRLAAILSPDDPPQPPEG